ncbi:MAG: cysteine synthase A [Oscillospiraceae bacterium]|nr:cysteine synthase A [Oscillospiraceae bacterium]
MIYTSMQQLIGSTPLLELSDNNARILAKLEMRNPAGSVKDRAAAFMIADAENRGLLTKETVIIEPTSGNTGIGLCAIAAAKGYRCIIVMPDTMSRERQLLMKAYGAEVTLTPGAQGMSGAIAKAKELASALPSSFIPDQFGNKANAEAHFATTGPEIWADTEGKIDAFVCGVGTGGTITGVGRYLKSQNPDIRIIAVEPAGSAVLSGNSAGKHGIQGIGAGFVPEVLDTTVIDEILQVADADAVSAARELAQKNGLLIGISSGAALFAAKELAKRPEFAGKTIVTLFPDSGERYLSAGLYD